MEADFSWMYLIIFLMIPLARIIPRILKKLKSGNSESQEIPQRQFESNFNRYEDQSDNNLNLIQLNIKSLQNLLNLKPKTCLF